MQRELETETEAMKVRGKDEKRREGKDGREGREGKRRGHSQERMRQRDRQTEKVGQMLDTCFLWPFNAW